MCTLWLFSYIPPTPYITIWFSLWLSKCGRVFIRMEKCVALPHSQHFFLFLFLPFFFFFFLGPHLQHVEVLGLGVELEPQQQTCVTAAAMSDMSCTCDLHCSSWHRRVVNLIPVGFSTHWATVGTPPTTFSSSRPLSALVPPSLQALAWKRGDGHGQHLALSQSFSLPVPWSNFQWRPC